MPPAIPRSIVLDPRATLRNDRAVHPSGRAVLCWMQRAQRAKDNPALDAAIEAANELGLPLAVLFVLVPSFPGANRRHFSFLLDGLPGCARGIEGRGAAFVFRREDRDPVEAVLGLAKRLRAALVVGDENPVREPEEWRREIARRLAVPFVTVDADVVVPTSLFPKEEFAARTIRPKIHRHLDRFLVPGREPRANVSFPAGRRPVSDSLDPARLLSRLPLDGSAAPVSGVRGGTEAGEVALAAFLDGRLALYPERRNRPEHADGTSHLSAYLHFGHLGPRGVALAVHRARAPAAAKEAFLEELVVRRELAVNFVARNPSYDSWECLNPWARATLEEHLGDRRPALHEEEALEAGATGDPLWNAAQKEMVLTGRMHGYLRMYWGKKLLEWTDHPARAFEISVRLNDRWELDGRDPNGYAGIAWAIGGKHDRPWPERPVFGKVRTMTFASTSRKFDARGYMERIRRIEEEMR
jgi:deoxyribodipyrimidine photo-lyase